MGLGVVMSEIRRGTKVWVAGAALGWLLAVPHSAGVAAASTDATSAGADAAQSQDASANARSTRQTARPRPAAAVVNAVRPAAKTGAAITALRGTNTDLVDSKRNRHNGPSAGVVSASQANRTKANRTRTVSPTVPINQIFDTGLAVFVTGVRGAGWNNVALTFSAQESVGEPQAGLYVGRLGGTAKASPYFPTPPSDLGVTTAAFYGPNTHRFNPRLIARGQVQAVGSFQGNRYGSPFDGESYPFDQGMIYRGTPDGSGTWTPVNVPSSGEDTVGGVSACEGRSDQCSVAGTILHSTMGDLVVGNYDLTLDGQSQDPLTINAFIYNTATKQFTLLGSNGDPFRALNNFNTIYGIWQNGGQRSHLYTLAGGTGRLAEEDGQQGFIVTYDASTGQYGTPRYYDLAPGADTHFEGITKVFGGFSLAGEALAGGGGTTKFAAFVPSSGPVLPFRRNVDTIRYGSAVWAPIDFTNPKSSVCSADGDCSLKTANTIYQNKLMGVFIKDGLSYPQTYLAKFIGKLGVLPWWFL